MLGKAHSLVDVRLLDFDASSFEDQFAKLLRFSQNLGNLLVLRAMLLPVIEVGLVQWAVDGLQVLLSHLEVDI